MVRDHSVVSNERAAFEGQAKDGKPEPAWFLFPLFCKQHGKRVMVKGRFLEHEVLPDRDAFNPGLIEVLIIKWKVPFWHGVTNEFDAFEKKHHSCLPAGDDPVCFISWLRREFNPYGFGGAGRLFRHLPLWTRAKCNTEKEEKQNPANIKHSCDAYRPQT